jgi:hypothetical protein
MTISFEDYAAMRQAHEDNTCLCDEYSALVLEQAEEIRRLKARLEYIEAEEVLDDLDAVLARMDKTIESIFCWTEKIRRIDHV